MKTNEERVKEKYPEAVIKIGKSNGHVLTTMSVLVKNLYSK